MSTSGVTPNNQKEEIIDAFENVPEEVILNDVLIPLGRQSFSSLMELAKSSARFRRIIEDEFLWRALCNHYFPYLGEVNPQGIADHPRLMFKNEYERYKKLDSFKALNAGMKNILASLTGSVEQISPTEYLSSINLLNLYKISLANGHFEFWQNLNAFYRHAAFNLAAENGRLEVVKWFLTEKSTEISGVKRGIALRVASQFNHPQVVQCILDLSSSRDFVEQMKVEVKGISNTSRSQVFEWAKKNGLIEIQDAYQVFEEMHTARMAEPAKRPRI